VSIFIFSAKKFSALGIDKKAESLFELLPLNKLGTYKSTEGDIAYLDISGLSAAELKKHTAKLKKCGSSWGIIDPKGENSDPAAFFFEGAADYLSDKTLKTITKKRLAAPMVRAEGLKAGNAASGGPGAKGEAGKTASVLPAGKFEGWKSIHSGSTEPFFFLYISVSAGDSSLRSRLGEKNFTIIQNRLRDFLQQAFGEANALLWMENEKSFLYLIPPRAEFGKAAIEAGFKIILGSNLIAVEKLGLTIPVNFTAAIHYGKTIFQAPGKTGTVVSDAVNYVFHLGAKRAESDRLTLSDAVPHNAIPEGLKDLFIDAGVFEGMEISHSRRFSYSL
jgi:hypothetical protein